MNAKRVFPAESNSSSNSNSLACPATGISACRRFIIKMDSGSRVLGALWLIGFWFPGILYILKTIEYSRWYSWRFIHLFHFILFLIINDIMMMWMHWRTLFDVNWLWIITKLLHTSLSYLLLLLLLMVSWVCTSPPDRLWMQTVPKWNHNRAITFAVHRL